MTSILLKQSLSESDIHALALAMPAQTLGVVYDNNTFRAAGQKLLPLLRTEYTLVEYAFDVPPTASMDVISDISNHLHTCDALLAIGSGTINDVCKYSASRMHIPYAVCATAPSMNGYISANASLLHNGHKQSYSATAPAMLLADVTVLAHAPIRLIRSGLGDSICRTTAQADWLLSHLLLNTPYSPLPFEWLQPYEAPLLESSAALAQGDVTAIEGLMQTLIASGKGMYETGSSAPASQAEHMIAHTLEMLFPESMQHSFHGEQIAVTTLFMSRLQHELLHSSTPWKLTLPVTEDETFTLFGDHAASCRELYQRKLISIGDIQRLNDHIANIWEPMKEQLKTIMLSSEYIEEALQAVGAPTIPDILGVDNDAFLQATKRAHFTRDRFTFLDIAALAMP